MTGLPHQSAFLQQVFPWGKTDPTHAPYPLVAPVSITIGRDPRCQVILDSQTYGGVSRQHARVCPSATASSGWQICDLNSANGTFVNGYRLQGCQNLRHGDRITLAQDGPQFIFEIHQVAHLPTAPEPASHPVFSKGPISTTQPPGKAHRVVPVAPDAVTLSQLFPIISTGRDLTRKAYLVPGIVTVSFVVLMFVSIGNSAFFNVLLAAYIAAIAYYFVYQLCGKQKPWWLLAGAMLFTPLLLISPVLDLFTFVFRTVLPGTLPNPDAPSESFLTVLVHMFFGAGLMEELLKAIPVLLAYFVGTKLQSPWRQRIGVWEPLDGILLGTASAVGFTLLETLEQYVPGVAVDAALHAGTDYGQLVGLQLLIPRILGSISGHMAYSGYLGYFIGLSVLKPARRWRILGVGYLTAATLHALWNTTGTINLLVLALVGVISYAFLAAAILKARALSPTRSQNFATRFSKLH
jgi:RsiW-degrading membrane proteinase PrsW (M82 family)